MQAGLLPARSVRDRLLALPKIEPLIEAANAGGHKGLLDENLLDKLLSEIKKKPKISEPIARTIAPIEKPKPKPAPRMHQLDHYRLDDFPIHAKDVDAEITVHFDITGNSVTEGKKEDIRSCFNDRLKQIRRLILDKNLPNRPIGVDEAIRYRKRYNNRDDAFTIIGLVNEPRTIVLSASYKNTWVFNTSAAFFATALSCPKAKSRSTSTEEPPFICESSCRAKSGVIFSMTALPTMISLRN